VADYTAKRIDDMDAGFGGAFKRARAELGVQSFGMQVLDFPPNIDQYPEHDHAEAGQEEVFWLVRGSGWIEIDGERVDLDPETMVRVGPAARRKLYSGPEGARILALGGVPGKAYAAPAPTQIGGADPASASAS
jgi:mannose-6-phosphate isomerase-like protein (cupin superfamily)